jgi:muramoyltetrapeptide carboxypeptidase
MGILVNPATKAIWVGKAGFGAAQILEIFHRKKWSFPLRTIPIIGFSDTTYLHLLAHQNSWPSLHAPVLNLLKETSDISGNPNVNQETSIEELMRILKGDIKETEYTLKVLNPSISKHFDQKRILHTKVVGGNLSVILRNIGTPTSLNTKQSIVFLEDTNDFFNRGRDHLTHLVRSGIFDHAHAIFFGDWTLKGIPLEDLIEGFNQTLQERGIHIPILQASGFGHGPVNHVLPLGTKSTLEFTQDGKAILKCSVNQSAY